MTQWKKRVDLFKFVYSVLMNSDSKQEQLNKAIIDHKLENDWLAPAEYFINNKKEIIESVQTNMDKDWEWNRVSYVSKAILIASIAEYKTLKTPKGILIDQAVITAKKFDDSKNYKFINAVLEKLIQ